MPDVLPEDEIFVPTLNDVEHQIPKDEDDEFVPAGDEPKEEAEAEGAKKEEAAKPEAKEEPKEEPTEESHSTEAIARAVIAGIPQEEIVEMSPAELRRATRMMESVNKRISEAAPRKEEAKPSEDDEILKKLDDETVFDPSVASVVKLIIAKNQRLEKEVAELKPSVQEVAASRVRQEVSDSLDAIAPGFSKEFDASTAKGAAKRTELFGMLNAIYEQEKRSEKFTDTKTRVRRAVAALEMMPAKKTEKAEKNEAFEKAEEEFDKAALAEGVNRKPARDVVQIVEEMLASNRRQKKNPNEYRPKWVD